MFALSSWLPQSLSAQQATPEAVDFVTIIDPIIPADGGVYGVVVLDPNAATLYSHNATVPFVAASLYKLPLMAHIHKLAKLGMIDLTDTMVLDEWFWSEGTDSFYDHDWLGAAVTIEELLFAVGAWSSNVAAWALATLVYWPDVQATAREIGMTDTWMFVTTPELAAWPPFPGDSDRLDSMATASGFIDAIYGGSPVMITTPRDIATFFAGLIAGKVVSLKASWDILSVLSRQAIGDRFPALLPERAWLAHKTGNLPQVVHDAGIIYTASGPAIVVGMSEAMPDEWVAINALQQLALTVYDAFNRSALPTS
jgi:beta-lactamase class A